MESKKYKVIPKYDLQTDILYISNIVDNHYKESIEVGDNFILDFNEKNRPIALEILDASKFFKVQKFSLQHIKGIHLELVSDKDVISIKGSFILVVHNKRIPKPFIEETVNDINMPYMETSFGMVEA
jgi:uncharacterized protein YuzE